MKRASGLPKVPGAGFFSKCRAVMHAPVLGSKVPVPSHRKNASDVHVVPSVVASSVDSLLGRDFSDRDYFKKARDGHNAETLFVAPPLK